MPLLIMHYPFYHKSLHASSVRGQSYDAYIMHFPTGIRPFIQYITDVVANENYGFGAIVGLLGMGEDSWAQVRVDLLWELDELWTLLRAYFWWG